MRHFCKKVWERKRKINVVPGPNIHYPTLIYYFSRRRVIRKVVGEYSIAGDSVWSPQHFIAIQLMLGPANRSGPRHRCHVGRLRRGRRRTSARAPGPRPPRQLWTLCRLANTYLYIPPKFRYYIITIYSFFKKR